MESFFELVGFGWSKECKAPTISTGYARRRWYCCVFLILLSWCEWTCFPDWMCHMATQTGYYVEMKCQVDWSRLEEFPSRIPECLLDVDFNFSCWTK